MYVICIHIICTYICGAGGTKVLEGFYEKEFLSFSRRFGPDGPP